jgi:Protein of unknown function (DUF1579)
MGNGAAGDTRTNLNRRILSFHLRNLTRKDPLCEYLLLYLALVTCQSSLVNGRIRVMKLPTALITILFATWIAMPSFAQTTVSSPAAATSSAAAPSGQPNPQEMMKQMVELSKLNENHKLLSDLDGNWTYTIKFWMNPDPNAKPEESKGTAVRKSIMNGRFSTLDVTGKMEMPGPDGKKKEMTFVGHGIDGYDNVKQKFVGSWIDNMGTGIMFSEGTYDPATKTFTYNSEFEAVPGMKQQIREVIKVTDKDHHTLEWYENRGGQQVKTMEINYTRSGKK